MRELVCNEAFIPKKQPGFKLVKKYFEYLKYNIKCLKLLKSFSIISNN